MFSVAHHACAEPRHSPKKAVLITARWVLVVQDATGKECGLHSGNVVESASEQAKDDLRDLWQDGAVQALSKEQLQGMMDGKRDKSTMLVMYAPWCQYSQVSALAH